MTELNSPETHIYISTRPSRMLKQRVRKRNLEGFIKGKVKQLFQQIDDVPAEQLLYLKVNAKTLGNVPRLAGDFKL